MKKIIYSIIFLLSLNAYSQVSDTLLPNVYGSWNIKWWQYDGWSISDGYYYNFDYECGGDFDWNGLTWTFVSAAEGEGLLRSDSGKVYCRGWLEPFQLVYAPNDTSEALLYDFTMGIGDTAYYDESWPIVVEGIGISNILGVPKKAWFLSNDDTIVQGLGSQQGLFRPWISHFESKSWICSFDGIYKDSLDVITNLFFSTSACQLSLHENTIEFSIYPNPTNGIATIAGNNIEYVEVYSISGELIQSVVNTNDSQINLNLSDVESGIYLVKIFTADSEMHLVKLVRG